MRCGVRLVRGPFASKRAAVAVRWCHIDQANDHACIDFVCFGELIHAPREVSNLSWIHDGDWQFMLVKHGEELPFKPACGFQTDYCWTRFVDQQ